MLLNGIKLWIKRLRLLKKADSCSLGFGVIVNSRTVLEGSNRIGSHSCISNTQVGYASYMGEGCRFPGAVIGRYCSIGNDVHLAIGKHPINGFVSTHPSFFSTRKQAGFSYVDEELYEELPVVDEAGHHVIVGNDVWIGNDAIILQGVSIGDGAVVAAGAVVTKDIPAFSIVAGIPAKTIGQRFSSDQIDALKTIEWWNRDPGWIKDNARLFGDIDLFLHEV